MTTIREPLTRERVLQAALKLADEGGVESLSMRKVAKAVGVEAMSLYNHVKSKDDLLDGLVDVVFAEIEPPRPGTPWQDAMRRRAICTREALGRHPWAIGLMEARSAPGPANLRLHEAVLRCLREAGFSVEQTARAYSIQDSFIYGFALQEKALPAFDSPAVGAQVAERILARGPYPDLPYSVEMIDIHIRAGGYNLTAEFAFGLDVILAGLERLLATPGPAPPADPGAS